MIGYDWLRKLVDDGTFEDIEGIGYKDNPSKIDGVYSGLARIKGVRAGVIVQEPDYFYGTMGEKHIRRMIKLLKEVIRERIPLVAFFSSGGARFQEGNKTLYLVSRLLHLLCKARERSLYVSCIMGATAGGSAISASLADLLIMDRNSSLFIYGPSVARNELGLEVKKEELGGAGIQAKNGTASIVCHDENECIALVKEIISLFYRGRFETEKAKDITQSLKNVFDSDKIIEIYSSMGSNVITGFSTLQGKPVAFLSVEPKTKDGYLSYDDTLKILNLVEFCNRRKINLLVNIDSPGFSPLSEDGMRGIVNLTSRIASILSRRNYTAASFIQGRCFGGLFVLLCTKGFGSDETYALEKALISVSPEKTYYQITKSKEKFEHLFSAKEAAKIGLVSLVRSNEELRKKITSLFK